ncbi:unnamed protein product [Gongylonema pulchrum]|uniref:SWIM-type domain-containing protein n=1 Tax=Gongylonema pulchrum TaxID=637853 RepID=A0A183E5R8_9BILA|nr:unnamed protein product [Gongylonema pulchrum]
MDENTVPPICEMDEELVEQEDVVRYCPFSAQPVFDFPDLICTCEWLSYPCTVHLINLLVSFPESHLLDRA